MSAEPIVGALDRLAERSSGKNQQQKSDDGGEGSPGKKARGRRQGRPYGRRNLEKMQGGKGGGIICRLIYTGRSLRNQLSRGEGEDDQRVL